MPSSNGGSNFGLSICSDGEDPVNTDAVSEIIEKEIQLRQYGNAGKAKLSAAQSEVFAAWEEDRASYGFVVNSLNYADELSNKMLDTLSNFEDRVDKLLVKTGQLQMQTETWKRVHTNITDSLSRIDDTLSKFDAIEELKYCLMMQIASPATEEASEKPWDAASVEGVQVEEPEAKLLDVSSLGITPKRKEKADRSGDAGQVTLDTYLGNLESIQKIRVYISEHSSYMNASDALNEIAKLRVAGMTKVYLHYSQQLAYQTSSPIQILCELIEDTSSGQGPIMSNVLFIRRNVDLLEGKSLDPYIENENNVVKLVSDEAKANLQKVVLFLQQNRQSSAGGTQFPYLELYHSKRSSFLSQTIQGTFSLEMVLKGGEDMIVSRHKRGIVGTYLKPVRGLVIRDQNGSAGARERGSYTSLSAAVYRKGSHIFLQFMRCLLVLLKSERALAEYVIQHRPFSSFSKVSEDALSKFSETGDQLLQEQKKNPNRIYGISVLLDSYGLLKKLIPGYRTVLKPPDAQHESTPITSFYSKLESACQQLFEQVLGDVRSDSAKLLPSDGNVHELSSMTISFLVHLFEYRDVVIQLLPPAQSSGASPLGEYIVSVIAALKENLIQKTKKGGKKQGGAFYSLQTSSGTTALSNIFLLNNYHFICKNVQNSALCDEIGKEVCAEYFEWMNEQQELYRQSWNSILGHISWDLPKDRSGSKKGGGSKVKASIKSKLKSFNSEITESYIQQKQYLIPDAELLKMMHEMLVKLVVPKYRNFLENLSRVEFTKNRSKYIKLDAPTLEKMLNRFFKGSLKEGGSLEEIVESLRDQADKAE
ncbi:exocyst complex component 7-like [Schistocerca gregaria]|uniref:exocyst complex component 7-like n=1 Tax=Schistocerca gregaria TaxID=7010 RepID=UPI00211EEEC8|nr:exocyst complex component 7-like [Schistocerca gregaria]XP_049848694.1 exocyst complex component 7-like [Schistocerca gregaria]